MATVLQIFLRIGHTVLVGWWFLTRPNTCGVKCLLVSADNKVLLVKQSYGDGRWSVPGGGVKSKESAIDAARRELREETGLHTELHRVGSYQQQIEYKNDTVEVFVGILRDIPKVIIDNREIIAYEWFHKESLPKQCRPSVRKIIAMYENSQSPSNQYG